jgi:hypothetical protein
MELYRRTAKYREYQDYLDSFKKSPGKISRQKLQSSPQESSVSSKSRRSESCDTDESAGNLLSPFDTDDECLRKDSQECLSKAMSDLRRFKMRYNDVATYCSSRLPDEALVRQTVMAFIHCSESLIHTFTSTQAEALLNRVYQTNQPTDALSLAELCIAAAIGSHYVPRHVPKRCIWEFFASACVLLDTVPVCEATYLRIMRLFLCLTLYSILEKHLSARSFVRKCIVPV